jgi:hypothetical protein
VDSRFVAPQQASPYLGGPRKDKIPMEAIIIVLPEARRCAEVLDAMRDAGAPGATVFDSQGREFLLWYDAHPALARHWSMDGLDRATGKTILAIVPDAMVDLIVLAAERVLDGFSTPNSGMLCTFKVGHFRCFQGDKTAVSQAAYAAELHEVRS